MRCREKRKKSFENDQFQSFFLKISRKNSKTSTLGKPTVCIKSLNISSFFKISGQDNILTVSLSKIHRQNLKNIFFNEANNV